jgi:two-component system response regulator RegA
MDEEKETILVVDDNDTFRERLARSFSLRGFTVLTANGYGQAIRVVEKHLPDRAVVDLKMPGKSGLELVKDAVGVAPDIRIVVLTGYGSIATAIDAMKLGAVSYLAKPADVEEILHAFTAEPTTDARLRDLSPPTLPRVEWEHIQRVLHDCDGNISVAAKKLNIHRRTLQRKLQKYAPNEKP